MKTKIRERHDDLEFQGPPKGLAARTLQRLRQEGLLAPVRRRSIWLRPITQLPARLATAAALVLALGLLFHPGAHGSQEEFLSKRVTADYVASLQERILGEKVTQRLSIWGDAILDSF